MSRGYIAYIRVSTQKQGEQGVSLEAQRDAIIRFAQRNNIVIMRWFEERVTAAKRGRPVFAEVFRMLRNREAQGLVIHKVDRSARNLWDWAQLGFLIDDGIDVRFAGEDVDMRTTGGRLSADVQAVIAAHYTRNLREEAKKGIYGRLKNGIYPFAAPLGYLDAGAGKPKTPDPVRAPMVRQVFESYASGRHTLRTLQEELNRRGLRTRRGGDVALNTVSRMLRNTFYIGIIRIRPTGECFRGAHQPLVPKSLFDRVQARLDGKVHTKGWVHDFMFRRLLSCSACHQSMIGERQKGHVYYRCHTQGCRTKSIREETIDRAVVRELEKLVFTDEERTLLKKKLDRLDVELVDRRAEALETNKLQLANARARFDRITDAFVDNLIDQATFTRRKEALLMEQKTLEEQRQRLESAPGDVSTRIMDFLELVATPVLLYESALPAKKTDFVKNATSNRFVDGKNVTLTLAPPFWCVAERNTVSTGRPIRDTTRTMDELFAELVQFFSRNDTSSIQILREHQLTIPK